MSLRAGVVIIGRNVGARLTDCLTSVLAQDVPAVYVDSGSTDDSLARAGDLGVAIHRLSEDQPFSAARGRNEGFVALLTEHPDLDAVLFLDGDCTIDAQVLPAGLAALEAQSDLALVCSPVREKDRDRDVWKTLCDLEWDQPPGPIEHCGGIFLIRSQAYLEIGGMDAGIIAGEEPEMCLMLSRKGWKLERIEEGLVEHDVGAFDFGGWWIRARRAGLAFLLGFLRDGLSRDMQNLRETLRPWFWGVALPILVFGAYLLHPAGLFLLLLYPLHMLRMMLRMQRQGRPLRDAWLYSAFNMLGRWAEVAGQLRLLLGILFGSAPAPHGLRATPVFRFALRRNRKPRQGAPRIGVVVIGRNEGERLIACLESLRGEDRSIVYVDSGSTDSSVAAAEARGAEVVALDMAIPFTAARARNAGFHRLQELEPELDYVQFVDGDCAVAEGWLDAAAEVLESKAEVVAVSGRRREIHPEHSIYNRLADFEWDTPLGPTKWCGGDVMMRADVLAEVGGYDDDLIACEEPELCFRLRTLGWTILRIAAPMTHHDADIRRFSQWWSRCRRTGYSYLQASTLHWGRPGRFLRSEIRSGLIWGICMPTLLLSCLLEPLLLVLFLGACTIQALRIMVRRSRRNREASAFSLGFTFFTIFINFPIALGMIRFLAFRARGRESRLIEYK